MPQNEIFVDEAKAHLNGVNDRAIAGSANTRAEEIAIAQVYATLALEATIRRLLSAISLGVGTLVGRT